MDVEHLLIDLLHGHAASEDSSDGQVPAVTGIASSHHVLSIKHLLGELRNSEGPVLLAATRCQGSKTRHEKVQSGEGYHVDCQLPEIGIELTREPEAGGDAGHGEGYQMVQVSIGRGGKFQGTETNIIKCLVVNAERLVSVFYQLVDRQGGVVGFDHCITDLV